MATLIPSFGSCTARMAFGERRLAERLEAKLDDDYLLWYDVPMGPRNTHPDFCVLHPRRGILVLEVKDWKLSTILRADKPASTPKPWSTHWSKANNSISLAVRPPTFSELGACDAQW